MNFNLKLILMLAFACTIQASRITIRLRISENNVPLMTSYITDGIRFYEDGYDLDNRPTASVFTQTEEYEVNLFYFFW